MKSLEMQPTHENVFETLIHGRIGRTDDVFRFVEFLNSIDGSFSVALPLGKWKNLFRQASKDGLGFLQRSYCIYFDGRTKRGN